MNTYPVRNEPEIKAWVEQLEREVIAFAAIDLCLGDLKPATVFDDAWTLVRKLKCSYFELNWDQYGGNESISAKGAGGWECSFVAPSGVRYRGYSTSPALAICQAIREYAKEDA